MGWDACTQDQSWLVRWMECHPGTSSYVQAAGVILTVAIALFGPPLKSSYDRWQEARKKRKNSDVLATSSRHDIRAMRAKIAELLESIPKMPLDAVDLISIASLRVIVPGGVDQTLLRNSRWLDMERLKFMYDYVEEIRDYNNSLNYFPFGDDKRPEREVFRAALIERLRVLKSGASEVLDTIAGRA